LTDAESAATGFAMPAMAVKFCGEDAYPNLTAFVRRIEARDAYQRAIEKSGE